MAFNKRYLAVGFSDGTSHLWDFSTGSLITKIVKEGPPCAPLQISKTEINCLRILYADGSAYLYFIPNIASLQDIWRILKNNSDANIDSSSDSNTETDFDYISEDSCDCLDEA